VLMLTVSISAFWIHQIRLWGPWSPIHLLAIFTLIMLPIAVLNAHRHRVPQHRMAMTLIFLGALVVAGLFTLVPGRIMHALDAASIVDLPRVGAQQARERVLDHIFGRANNRKATIVLCANHHRLLTALRHWQMFYRHSPYSRWAALQKLFVEPLLPAPLSDWIDRRSHPGRIAAWQDHAAIRPDFAAAMAVRASCSIWVIRSIMRAPS